MSLAASHAWPLHELNVKNAFLHGDLLETIYMDPPPGFRAEGEYAEKMCHLHKSLYGMKQSLRPWFIHFSDVILSMEFVRCTLITLVLFLATLMVATSSFWYMWMTLF